MLLWDAGGICGIAGMGVAVVLIAVRNARRLAAADPLPGKTS